MDAQFKNCKACPSFVPEDQVLNLWGKSIGAPICGRLGKILGRPGTPERQIDNLHKHIASSCAFFGQPNPGATLDRQTQVAMPNLEAMQPSPNEQMKKACTTCAACTKYIQPHAVAEAFGWTEGMCSATGRLLLGNKLTFEARNCEYREWGSNSSNAHSMVLLPEYEDAFAFASDPIRAYFKNKDMDFVDPADYETDREVTEDEAKGGIRAWRKIIDPEGSGAEVFLPIYRRDFFEPEEQAKIPRSGDDEHPELYVDHFGGVYTTAVAWTELDETPAAWGEAGNGKTELFRHLAWLMCLPFERMSITAETTVDELIGKMLFIGNETVFQYGRLPRAWQKPCVLVVDEPNAGPPEVWQTLRPLTDNSKQLVIDQNNSERITRHDDCYLGMAMNPAWDTKNVGVMPIADADARRLYHIYVYPPPEILEREIIKARVSLDGWEMPDAMLDMVMSIAKDLRGLSEDGTLPVTWGVAQQIKVARGMRWFEPITAYKRAIGDFLEPEAQEVLLSAVRQHVVHKN